MKKALLITAGVIVGIAMLYLAVGLSGGAFHSLNKSEQQAIAATPVYKPATKDELLKLVNEERAKVGVAPLTVQGELEQSAQWKADKIVATGVFEHTDPNTGKNDGLDYLNTLGANCVHISENLHYGSDYYATSLGTTDGWVHSKAHYDAMVDPKYSTTGFGIATRANGDLIAVEHFCQKP